MGENFSGDFDLFGEPVPVRRGQKGRPAHVRTQENANKISLLLATGHDEPDCALALGISMPTLRKHYFFELSRKRGQRMRVEAARLAKLAELGIEGGNVAALKELGKSLDKAQLAELSDRVASGRKAKGPPKGKKEMAKAAAQDVKGIFAPRGGFPLN